MNCELETMATFPEADSDSGSPAGVVAKAGLGAAHSAMMEQSSKNDATDRTVAKRMVEAASRITDLDRVRDERQESCQRASEKKPQSQKK